MSSADTAADKTPMRVPNGEWPLVTLAVLTYNQEQWVETAMAGAFAQDYPNLEIIVSDDCSEDDTFHRIQQTARAYNGPHRVLVRQTEKNVGSLLHAAGVATLARGELLVLAAGDDISKANRVAVLLDAWKRTGAWGLCSRYDLIDESGIPLAMGEQAAVLRSHGFDRYFLADGRSTQVVHGCTSAYDARLFGHLRLTPEDYVLSEDGALSVLLNLLGKPIAHLEESLILYRQSSNSLTNSVRRLALTFPEIDRDEANILRFAQAQANRCRLFLRMDEDLREDKVRRISRRGVEAELLMQEVKANWYVSWLGARALSIVQRSVPWRWALPRLFGRRLFYCLKWVASRRQWTNSG